jgi:Zinc finger, C2H2 type
MCHPETSTNRVFTCDHCGLHTKYKMNLYRHIKSVHLNTSGRFACPHVTLCPEMIYTTKESLNLHLYRVHNVPAPVTCSSCQLGFTYNSEIKTHRRVCAGSSRKPRRGVKNKNFRLFCEVTSEGFKCKVCQKTFDKKPNWSYHYSAHHRDNRTCEICNREFSCYTNFLRHQNVHHRKIKNFHCDYPGCGKSFGQKTALANHTNTHTGDKPFHCNLCSFRSGDKSTIFKHKKKIHP